MKLRVFILSVFIMALSLVPCSDSMPLSNFFNPQKALVQSSINHNGHDHSNKADFCSPLCSCNCCGSIIASISLPETLSFSALIPMNGAHQIIYNNPEYSSYIDSIWQPPKIKA